MGNTIPNALSQAEIYFNGSNNLSGTAEVTLPKAALKTVENTLMGVASDLGTPLQGHFEKLEAKIHMDCIDGSVINLKGGDPLLIEVLGAAQRTSKETHGQELYGVEATMKGQIISLGDIKMKPGDKMEVDIELAVTYYKLDIDKKTVVEIDVLNNITNWQGIDNTLVRQLLGLI